MFIILGGDGKEYGPASTDQIKDWMQQGRVDENTQIKRQGETEWKKINEFSEFSSKPIVYETILTQPSFSGEAREWNVNIGGCLSRAWNLVVKNPMPFILATLVAFLAMLVLRLPSIVGEILGSILGAGVGTTILVSIFTIVGAILTLVFQGVVCGGYYYFILRMIRGESVQAMDVLDGFKRNFVQLILGGVVSSLLIGLGIILCILPGIYLSVSYLFAWPLIIDKEMGFWDAMELSRKTIWENFWMMLVLMILLVILSLLGILACIVGLLFTAPIATATLMYAYEDAFKKS